MLILIGNTPLTC